MVKDSAEEDGLDYSAPSSGLRPLLQLQTPVLRCACALAIVCLASLLRWPEGAHGVELQASQPRRSRAAGWLDNLGQIYKSVGKLFGGSSKKSKNKKTENATNLSPPNASNLSLSNATNLSPPNASNLSLSNATNLSPPNATNLSQSKASILFLSNASILSPPNATNPPPQATAKCQARNAMEPLPPTPFRGPR
nr:circumsporozoite protein [Microcebus murinus]